MEKQSLLDIKNPEVLKKAIDKWGCSTQSDMAIEEMSELTKAILKFRRACLQPDSEKIREAETGIVEEAADVAIMLAQVIMMYDHEKAIQSIIDYKVNRLQKRLRGEGDSDA